MTNTNARLKVWLPVFSVLCLQALLLKGDTANGVEAYPQIYPFVPAPVSEIHGKVAEVSEDPAYLKNLFEMEERGFRAARAAQQPWTSSYWPLDKGIIADTYRPRFNPFAPARELRWQRNERRFQRRLRRQLSGWRNMSNEQLEDLAPSEKYDLLLGDETFDLTRRMWDYVERTAEGGEGSFVTALRPTEGRPEDYQVVRHRSKFKTWEGICHGWATASINIPRPEHSVDYRLPNGKRLRFYPSDIKALASLLWANSLAQDNRYYHTETGEPLGGAVLYAGLRCNEQRPAIDQWGRTYDAAPDRGTGQIEPRCVGVHPAVWHMSLVNLIGVQRRSFIVERKIAAPIDNHPLASYRSTYFDPNTGTYGTLRESLRAIDDNDQFRAFRSPESTHIVGVRLAMKYTDWERASREETDSPARDSLTEVEMLYDLELNARGDIVGGQWRATEVGGARRRRAERTQPNFFWVIAKDQLKYFPELELSEWRDPRAAPPADWGRAARDTEHSFIYQMIPAFGFNEMCDVRDRRTGRATEVPCDLGIPKPQPLVNVVNQMVRRSRQ